MVFSITIQAVEEYAVIEADDSLSLTIERAVPVFREYHGKK